MAGMTSIGSKGRGTCEGLREEKRFLESRKPGVSALRRGRDRRGGLQEASPGIPKTLALPDRPLGMGGREAGRVGWRGRRSLHPTIELHPEGGGEPPPPSNQGVVKSDRTSEGCLGWGCEERTAGGRRS